MNTDWHTVEDRFVEPWQNEAVEMLRQELTLRVSSLILPRCLRGEALEWLIDLESDTVQEMNDSMYIWETELLKQFGKSQQQAMQEALHLHYCFATRHTLSISFYLTRKIALLREAGINDQIQLNTSASLQWPWSTTASDLSHRWICWWFSLAQWISLKS